jgi:sodium-dependent dicarboxylate transporter 2/3/5
MLTSENISEYSWRQPLPGFGIVLVAVIASFAGIESPVTARIVAIAGLCLLLWLLELVPPFVPTLLLWVLIPTVLSSFDPKYSMTNTLRWAADPVLALFFGGFALGVGAERHGLDRRLAAWVFGRSHGSFTILLAATIGLTGFLSMWISNIAAAALMFACIRPFLVSLEEDDPMRRSLLVGVALGANLGGMATPIGTGPNAIAIASISGRHQVTFIDWMAFALPLTIGLLALGFIFLRWRAQNPSCETGKTIADRVTREPEPRGRVGQIGFLSVFAVAVLLWLTEPLHAIPAAAVALGAAASLFLFRLLKKSDLARIDWSTLLLIAGGITMGRLIEASGIVSFAAERLAFADLDPTVALFVLCFSCALLSALMSNTATAVLLIPLAVALMPQPSTAILIAVSASFGMPFIISTPPNAMAHGEGGLHSSDLFYPGLVIMIVGCALVSLTGRAVLNFAGIP